MTENDGVVGRPFSVRSGEACTDKFPIGFHVRRREGRRRSSRDATTACAIRKLTSSHPDIDAISSYYRTMDAVDVLQRREPPDGRTRMMGRLRSTMARLGAVAALVGALSVAGPGPSHAATSTMSATDDAGPPPCNDVCKAYMAWTDHVAAMLHSSSPPAQATAHDGKPAGRMVHHRASRARQQGLNAFAQIPVPRDAAAQPAEASQTEVAPSRSVDAIAERFPTTAGFVTALLASTARAANDAPDSMVVPVTDAIPTARETGTIDAAAGGVDMQFTVSRFLALCLLSGLAVWGWFRTGTPRAMR